jgi:cobaltochelatase CobN
MEEATTATETESSSSHSSSSSSNDKELEITNQATTSGLNQTTSSQVGAGADLSKPAPEAPKSTPENYVEGYEMTKETVSQLENNSSPTFSSSDLVAFVLVAVAAGAVFLGFMRKKKM